MANQNIRVRPTQRDKHPGDDREVIQCPPKDEGGCGQVQFKRHGWCIKCKVLFDFDSGTKKEPPPPEPVEYFNQPVTESLFVKALNASLLTEEKRLINLYKNTQNTPITRRELIWEYSFPLDWLIRNLHQKLSAAGVPLRMKELYAHIVDPMEDLMRFYSRDEKQG
jgi:hypothetical protein